LRRFVMLALRRDIMWSSLKGLRSALVERWGLKRKVLRSKLLFPRCARVFF
jgi:hypothetical protein